MEDEDEGPPIKKPVYPELAEKKCLGPNDCKRVFKPITPWDRLCSKCKEHPVYTSGLNFN